MRYLHLESWAGHRKVKVRVLQENAKTTRIVLLEDCMKGKEGTVLVVPKYAVS